VARYRWTILALGTGAQTAYSAVFLGIPVLAPALQKEYELTLTQVGLAIAAANAGSVFTLLAWASSPTGWASASSWPRDWLGAESACSSRPSLRPSPCSCSRSPSAAPPVRA
jgi:hypothetical protein